MDALAAGTPPGGRMSSAGSVLVRTALGGVSKPGREDRAMISGRPPSPDAGYFLARPRLDAIADRLPTVTAALVVGSGGYGKSTVMAAWQRRLDVANVTTAWVALAPRDASLSAFVERLGTTLHAALPDLGDSAQRLVDAGISDPVLVARALINELYVVTEERAERLVVFIDDLHCVLDDVATVAFVGEFMREMPPRVHAAFASRRPLTFAPIAKLRNAGRLIEIAERDLRFTADEAAQLVGDRERGDRLATQTQGWTIAVRLGASLAASGGVSFDAIFAGVRDHAFDFLAQEVVAHLAPGDRNDLMTLAIPASFDEATATMLLGRDDAAATIERLVARGVYLENSQAAWQFHQLFREFLLRRMRVEVPEFERAKRRRYSEYLRNRGETVEALGQLIEAGDFLEIVEYVHEATLAIRYSDRLPQLFNLLSQVPDDVKRQKPMLYRLHGLALQRIGRYDAATEQFAACYEAAHALGDRRTKCIALLERGVASGNFRLQGHGTFAASEGYFREALAIAESPEFDGGQGYRRIGHYLLGMAIAARCAYDEAFEHLGIAERLELAEERHTDPILIGIAIAHGWRGQWHKALEYAELAEEFFRGSADFHVGFALLMQARVHYMLREDLPRALALAKDAEARLGATHNEDERADAIILQGLCALAFDPPGVELARDLYEDLRSSIQQRNALVRIQYDLLRAEIALATGEVDTVRMALDSAKARATFIADGGMLANVLLVSARLIESREGRAQAAFAFEAARGAYDALGDRVGAMVARLYRAACDDGDDAKSRSEIDDILIAIELGRIAYALDVAPVAAQTVLMRSLRIGVSVERAEGYLSARNVDGDTYERLALDTTASAVGRVAALRLLAALDGQRAARLALALLRDDEQLVAISARTFASLPRNLYVEPLVVDVIGELRVTIGAACFGERDGRFTRKKAAELLRYLVLADAPVSRTTLLSALWPDAESGAEVTLRVTLHALRRALEPDVEGAGNYIYSNSTAIGLCTDHLGRSDVQRAFAALGRAKLLFARNAASEARTLLDSVARDLAAAPKDRAVARWLAPFVTQWRTAAVDANRTLARVAMAGGDQAIAVASARLAHELDPLDEETIMLLIEFYARSDAFDDARLVFRTYKRRLFESIGTSPGAELVARYSRIVSRGIEKTNFGLSDREREVLRLIARGRSNKEIAVALELSPFTINNHVARILRKLNVDNRAAAVSVASSYLESVL